MIEMRSHDERKEAAEELLCETMTAGNSSGTAELQVLETPSPSQWRDVCDQFTTHKGALVGAVVFLMILISVVFGPYIWHVSPSHIDFTAIGQEPSSAYPLGTDQLGRDLLARMMSGGRISVAVGLAAMIISIFLGALVGVLAGYFKVLDGALMRLTDIFLALPVLPLLLVMMMLFRDALANILGVDMGIFTLIVAAIGATSWMQTARIVRGEVLTIKQREFVLASRSIGTPPRRIILRHVLPNVLSPIMVSATLGVAEAVITESVLSFLGLGFPPDFPTWGRLLYDGIEYMQEHPEMVLWPGIAISLTVLSVNYVGDGLRDALDPRLRR